MLEKVKGKITDIKNNSIIMQVGSLFFELLVSNPYAFKKDSEQEVYTKLIVKQMDEEILLFGFKTELEKELFSMLISVSGIGPKTALCVLAKDSVENIAYEIKNKNYEYLSKVPKIGLKTAQKIIIELSDKLDKYNIYSKTSDELKMVVATLKTFGYKEAVINKAISKIEKTNDLSQMVKDALKVITTD